MLVATAVAAVLLAPVVNAGLLKWCTVAGICMNVAPEGNWNSARVSFTKERDSPLAVARLNGEHAIMLGGPGEFALDVKDGDTTDGNLAQIWQPGERGGNANQRFELIWGEWGQGGRQLKIRIWDGTCLDVRDGKLGTPDSNTFLQWYACGENNPNQIFWFE